MLKKALIVMGVSGSGKSSLGAQLAAHLDVPFFDADDYHSPENVQKMVDGIPLSDADRQDWLRELSELISEQPGFVLACSALRKSYREQFRQARPDVTFLYLKGDIETIWNRHAQRENHYFTGRGMLESQFAQLEVPQERDAIHIEVNKPVAEVLANCLTAIGK